MQDDMTDAFSMMPIAQKGYCPLGFRNRTRTFVVTRLAIGCRSSPILYATLTALLAWLLFAASGIRHVSACLDDFFAVTSAADNAAWQKSSPGWVGPWNLEKALAT